MCDTYPISLLTELVLFALLVRRIRLLHEEVISLIVCDALNLGNRGHDEADLILHG